MSVVIRACPDCGGDVVAQENGWTDWYHQAGCPMAERVQRMVIEYEAWLVENERVRSALAIKDFLAERDA